MVSPTDISVAAFGQPDGEVLRKMREDRGITLDELADWLDLEPHQLSSFEQGKRWLPIYAVKKLINLVDKDGGLKSPYTKPNRIITLGGVDGQ